MNLIKIFKINKIMKMIIQLKIFMKMNKMKKLKRLKILMTLIINSNNYKLIQKLITIRLEIIQFKIKVKVYFNLITRLKLSSQFK